MGVRTNPHPSGMLSIAMLATAGLLAAVSLGKVTRVFVVTSRMEEATKKTGITATPSRDQVDKAVAADKAVAEELKKANLFAPPQPKQNPVREVYAILGNEVLINGRWCRSGDKVEDANIVSVEPTHVVVEWNGQRTNLYPIQATVAAPDTSSQPGGRFRGRGGGPGMTMGGGPTMTMIGPGSLGRGGRGGMGIFNNMTDQDRQRIQNMSSDERRNFFMQQFGGGMQGGMPGGGMGMRGGDTGGGGRQRGGGGGAQGGGPGGGGGGGGGGRGGGRSE